VAQELGSYKLIPGLARTWDISKDGLIYTFNLRPNVTFHDGTPFNAEAVKFCYERQLNEDGPYYKTGTYPYVKGFLGNVQSIEVVNPLTVQIKLKAPLTPFLQYLAHQSLFIYSPDALKKYGKDIVKNPMGTGPFKLETWEPGVKVVLARNDQYWGGAPKLRQAIYVPIIEAQARLAAIKTGEIDLTIDVPPDSLDSLRKDPNITVAEANSSAVWYVALNTRHPILKDKRVRQAMNLAINKEAIIRDILKGTAIVSTGPMSPVYGPFREEKTTQYPYDPAKAKALLKEAGYGPGQLKFKILAFTEPGESEGPQVAEALGIYYKDVGVETEIEVLDWAKVRDMFRKKTIQCCIWPNIISWRPAEEWIRTSYYSKSATHHYENEFIDKTYNALTQAVKPEERQRLARSIADHLFEEFADIPLFWFANEVVANPRAVSEWVYPGLAAGRSTHFDRIRPPK